MSAVNDTNFKPAVFLLTGISGQKDIHLWISVHFCLMYVISIVGNSVILFIIKTDPSLHEPMYIFLSMLAVTDFGLSMSTMPMILGMFLFNSREISLGVCFAQLFFIHLFSFTESSVLLLMAFDLFVAICNPMRYASILTPPRIAKMGQVFVLRGVAVIFPLPFLLKHYQYCQASVLSDSYCINQKVMKMACSDVRVNYIYDFFVTISIVGLNSLLILLSYMMILKTVLSIASQTECLRALSTCISHSCTFLLFYTPMVGLSVIHRFWKSSSPLLLILIGYIYLVISPMMKPIVYSVKSKHLCERIIRVFVKRRVSSSPGSSADDMGNEKHNPAITFGTLPS